MFMDKATVLLVEDETKLLETLSDFLEINHYNVIQATDGLDGIQKFHAHRSETSCCWMSCCLLRTAMRY